MELEYAGCAYPVEGLGPGKRLAMWVYGCRRRCDGCISPELQGPGERQPLDKVIADLLPWLPAADGLTISGGEPFNQASALATLIRALREERDIEVLMYTGYLLEELQQRPETAGLLALVDLLVDGPFIQAAANTLQWRGSDNQRIHLLTPRAQQYARPGGGCPCPPNDRCKCKCSAARAFASSASPAAEMSPHTARRWPHAAWR